MATSKEVTTTVGKFTAAEIGENCPERLKQIAEEIEARLAKWDKETRRAENHLIAVDQLLAEARGLCDRGGFIKFRELFCPKLGKSQAYAMRAITAGKKTFAEHRAEERERKRRTRANKRAAGNSGTVPENADTTPELPQAPTEPNKAGTGTKPEPSPESAKSRKTATPQDASLAEFTDLTCRLVQKIAKFPPKRFKKTGVNPNDLAKLGKFFTSLANLKKPGVSEQVAGAVAQGNDSVSPEQSAEDMKAKHRVLETMDTLAA
jgi:hypothetical protein